ncbi:MAG: RDD family protein [Pseudomonadales bacterium]
MSDPINEKQSGPAITTPGYVGFWLRFVAFLIDSVPVFIVLAVLLPLVAGPTGDIDLTDISAVLARLSLESLVVAIIFLAFWMYFAATPGKMVVNAYIADAKTFSRASNGQLVVRYLCYYLSTFVFGLGFIWIAFDRRKQGWHDKIAGTVVIRGKPLDHAPDDLTTT